MEYIKTINCDVAVAGGGVAGVAAAVSAARHGKRVVLIEKTTQLGGLATIGLINFFVPMCNGRGVQIIKGMADEFLRLSIKYGFDTLPSDWKEGEPGQGKTNQRLVSRYSAPIFSLVLCELLNDLGVQIMFDTLVTDVSGEGGHLDSITLFNKSGYSLCKAKVFVDATGDADILYKFGVPTVTGGNYHSYSAFLATIESCKKVVESGDIANLVSYKAGGNANLYGKNHPEGKPLWDGTNGDDVTNYLIENQLLLLNNIKDGDRQSRDITLLPIMPQFRTTRRIDGDYTLTTEDKYKHFEDSIGAICDFDNRDILYEVPYRTLVRRGFDNLITAGRSAAAEGYAWDVLRVIPPAIITGQAAGDAAGISIDSGVSIAEINVSELQKMLEEEKVIIHFDDSLIPEDIEKVESVDIGHF